MHATSTRPAWRVLVVAGRWPWRLVWCAGPGGTARGRYDDLVGALHRVAGVPGAARVSTACRTTRAAAMAAQHRALAPYRARLEAIDPRGVARAAAGGLAHRPGRDERPRLRPPGPSAMGQQPGVLRHRASRPRAISPPVKGPLAWGAVELWHHQFPLSPEPRRGHRREASAASRVSSRRRAATWWATAGTSGSTARRPCASRAATSSNSPPRLGDDAPCADGPRRRGEGRHRRVRRLARRAGAREDRAVGHRHRALRLVPETRPPGALHVAGRTDR